MEPIRIIILEDDYELLQSVSRNLTLSDDLNILASYTHAEDLIKDITKHNPDIILVDIGLPQMNGIECIRVLKAQYPSLLFLMWTTFEDDVKIFDALKAGANGYILKTATSQQMVEAINELYRGGSPMSSSIARKVIASFHNTTIKQKDFSLTPRENEILELLAKGYRYKEIAEKLFISIETVRSHVYHIYDKLQVSSKTDALNKVYGDRLKSN